MSEAAEIQWFPGHMAKTRRIMQSNLKLVDVVVEIADARIPYSSRNPDMDRLVGSKPRILLLNKADSADAAITSQWLEHFRKEGVCAVAADCRSGKDIGKFRAALDELMKEKTAAWQARGMTGRPVRMMVVGIPNVGKSSFINRIAGSKRARVEDRPGVTRGKQWITLDNDLELLDMPGILWHKFDDKLVGERLAFTGAVKDDVLDIEYLACRFLEMMNRSYPQLIRDRYGIETQDIPDDDPDSPGCVQGFEILERIGGKRGFLLSGAEVNTERAAVTVLDEFRSGKLGRISLERPNGKDVI